MNSNRIREFEHINAVSAKTHPSPDEDSRFYRKFKQSIPLNNSDVIYRKHRVRLLSYRWNEHGGCEIDKIAENC